jgi:hypothetical protein
MWTREALEKARSFELCKQLSQRLSVHYPWLMHCNIHQVLARLAPVRHTPDGRSIRFYGVDCFFPHAEQAAVALFLLEQFKRGVGPVSKSAIIAHCDLPVHRVISDIFKNTEAWKKGLIEKDDGKGLYRWKVPEEEIKKPPLVILPTISE